MTRYPRLRGQIVLRQNDKIVSSVSGGRFDHDGPSLRDLGDGNSQIEYLFTATSQEGEPFS